jgi:hypothetical protein
MMKYLLRNILFVTVLALFWTCSGGYSFTGGSVGDAKTIRVQYFPNRAEVVNPSLSTFFAESLKDRFLQQSSLTVTNAVPDLDFEGEITDYRITPQAFQGNETAALNRLTITVKVKFTNHKDESKNFESSFSRYADYSSTESLTSVESQLVEEITNQLTEDIFNRALVNW